MEKELKQEKLVNVADYHFNTWDIYFSGYSGIDVVDFDEGFENDIPQIIHGPGTPAPGIIYYYCFFYSQKELGLDECIKLDKCTQIYFSFFLVRQFIKNRDSNYTFILFYLSLTI